MAKAGMATGVEVARISVKVSPDSRKFRRELQSDLEAIERSVTAKIDVEPDMKGFRRDVTAQTKGMRTSVKVDADVDRSFFSRLTERLRNIKGPDFGSGMNGMAGAAIGAGVLAVAAPLMGLLTTALLTLPGLLAAVLTPVSAIALGLDGIKKSAERLKEPFEGLKATMNAVNESAFGPVFDKLGSLFPTLERSLPRVSQGMADVADSIAGVVTSPESLAKIETTIGNIAGAISQAAPGFGSFTSGFLTLAEKFSEKMPDLSEWFNGAGKSFETWIEKITRPDWFTGESLLEKAFDGLGGTLRTILDTLGGMASAGMDFFSDPSKINDFNNSLKNVGDSLVRITELSNSLNDGNLFSSIMPTGLKLDGGFDWESFKADITKPFTSPDAGWRDMVAKLKEMGGGEHLSDGPDFSAWAEKMKEPFVTAWEWIKTTASSTWDSITSSASSAWSGVVNAVSGAVSSVGVFLTNLATSAAGIWDSVTAAASAAFQSLVSSASSAVSSVVSYVSALPGQIAAALSGLAAEGAAAGAALVQGLINGIGGMISSAVAKARELASGVANAVKGFLGINSPSRLFTEYGVFTGQGFQLGLEQGFQPVLEQAKNLAQRVSEAFASGIDPTGVLNGMSSKDIDRMEKALAFESKRLESQAKALDYQAKTTGNEALKARAAEIRMQKDQLGLQRDMLGLTEDYSDVLGNASTGDNALVDAASGLMAAPVNFAKSTAGQFMQDIGIGGNGIISKAIGEGIQYIFQVSSVDEAFSARDRAVSVQALAAAGR